jgi:hypothetical protein
VLVATACGSLPHLSGGPIEIGSAATLVRFDAPAANADRGWTLCFEFRLPRESEDAGRIVATLLTATRRRYQFATSELDRRGEFVVCRIGRLAPVETDASKPSGPASHEPFTAVELTADTPLRLRGLSGGPAAGAP